MKIILLAIISTIGLVESARVVCYWDGHSHWREGVSKVTTEEIKASLSYCTHLIYGFASIDDDDYHIEPIDKKLDLDKGKGQYRLVTELKRAFPGLTVLVSVGGGKDTEGQEMYFKVLEKQERRAKFVSSVLPFLRLFNFDGIDLAWQFPEQHEKYESTSISSIWHKIKKTVGVGVDSKASEHRSQFTSLVREMEAALKSEGKILSLGVLPHVNASVYYDIKQIMPHVHMVNLWTVDYRTPTRSPEKADYATPLYYEYPRLHHQNVDATVRYWIEKGADSRKLNLGISTWGRSWKLTTDSGLTGSPPLVADGPGKKGPYTKTEGLMSYFEACVKLVSPTNPHAPKDMLRRMNDDTKRLGTFAYRLPDQRAGEKEGMWLSFEEPETAAIKAIYAKQKQLGGVAILDLAMDDARGMCDGSKFPITRMAKLNIASVMAGLPNSGLYQQAVLPTFYNQTHRG